MYYTYVYPPDTLSTMKDVGLRIRVQRELREQFLDVCRAQDKPATQVLREFMREYVERHALPLAVKNKSGFGKTDCISLPAEASETTEAAYAEGVAE